jgi:hypothetical protein
MPLKAMIVLLALPTTPHDAQTVLRALEAL